MQIADEVHDELQRGGAIGAIELRIAEPLFPIRDPIDDAVAPAIAAAAGGGAGLLRAVAIAIVAARIRRNVQVVPVRRLHLIAVSESAQLDTSASVWPSSSHATFCLRDRRQPLGGDQSDEAMALPAPRVQ